MIRGKATRLREDLVCHAGEREPPLQAVQHPQPDASQRRRHLTTLHRCLHGADRRQP